LTLIHWAALVLILLPFAAVAILVWLEPSDGSEWRS